MNKLKLTFEIAVVLLCMLLISVGVDTIVGNVVEATTKVSGDAIEASPWIFTLTDAASSDSFKMQGVYVCKLDDAGGGAWGGGTVTLQKLLIGSTYVDVETSAFVGATVDVAWTQFVAGVGLYKWTVVGGTSMTITAHCAKAY